MKPQPVPEFSRPTLMESLKPGVNEFHVEAGPEERAALARRFGLVSIEHLAADLQLAARADRRSVRVTGTVVADVTQTCVVTLEPVKNHIDAPLDRLYGEDVPQEPVSSVVYLDDLEDVPDPVVAGAIDVGEAVAEQLALELDPFPRRPGVIFEGYRAADGKGTAEEGEQGPFAVLARMKRQGH